MEGNNDLESKKPNRKSNKEVSGRKLLGAAKERVDNQDGLHVISNANSSYGDTGKGEDAGAASPRKLASERSKGDGRGVMGEVLSSKATDDDRPWKNGDNWEDIVGGGKVDAQHGHNNDGEPEDDGSKQESLGKSGDDGARQGSLGRLLKERGCSGGSIYYFLAAG